MLGFTLWAQTQLFLTWLVGGWAGFTSVFIWIYTLTLPLERSASSIWVRMFSGEEVHVTGLSEGCLCQLLWKRSFALGTIIPQICHLMSHCLWLLGYALSHDALSPGAFAWCSIVPGAFAWCSISSIMYYFLFVTTKGSRSWKTSVLEDKENRFCFMASIRTIY